MGIEIKKTGRIYSIAGNQYQVTFPDGEVLFWWSHFWVEQSADEEMELCKEAANKRWSKMQALEVK